MTTPMPESIVDHELCTRCGCCVSGCPVGCINMDEYPVRGDGCTACGLCTTICPGTGIDLEKAAKELFPGSHYNDDVGRFLNTYTGYSRNNDIREMATSGGVVTSLLVCLLEQGVIDGALVVSFGEKPWKTEYTVATSKEEIIASAQTKYQVTPLDIPLKDLELEKIAVVGLPCVIQGLRSIQKNSPLGKKIKVLIGLFCWVNMEREATTFLLEKLGVDVKDVEKIEYRSGDYLGGFKVQLKNGVTTYMGKECYNTLPLLFAAQRCVYCADFTNELADISVGDAKFLQSQKGHTFIITRSQEGERVLKTCVDTGYIHTETCGIEEIIWSERSALLFKKGAPRRIQKSDINIFHGRDYNIPLKNRLFELLFMVVHRNRKSFKKLFMVMPLSFFRAVSNLVTRERS